MPAKTSPKQEKMGFQTEAKQLLNLVIHSLYSHKEIFLRELVSNASDALDRIRFEALTKPEVLSKATELNIRIKLNKKAKTLVITDTGIGMTKQEIIDNLGTIARSGTKAFVEKMTGDQKSDSNLIGKFGVGFYSAFMVAASVKVVSKRAGSDEPAIQWESDGLGEFSLSEADKIDHGTEITVYLKDTEGSFAEEWQVRSVIKKYSDFIAFPIYLPDDKGKDEIVNQTKPIWKRSPSEVKEEQYEEFFKQALGGMDKPLATIHTRAEGVMEYASILFLPEKAPFEFFNMERKHGVKLYVKRVFIMDDCKELLPEYLRFVKGIVDSEDLPLNVSREILQDNPVVTKIRKALVSKVLGKLKEMAEKQPDDYKKFWTAFGHILKEGLHADFENKDKLLELVRFPSSMCKEKEDVVSLKEYVGRMRENQKDIYYITGESVGIVEKSPNLEIFKDKSMEVLYFVDPIDDWIVGSIPNYDGKQLKSVAQGDLDLGDMGKEEKKEKKKAETELKKLTERFKNILKDEVNEVRVTTRLKDSPCCLVKDDNAVGVHMERIMKAMGQDITKTKPIMEINGSHPIIKNLNALYSKDAKSEALGEWVQLLFDQSKIAEGQPVSDPALYAKRVNELLAKATEEAAKS